MKKVFLTKKQIESICDTYDTPFYIYDEKGIREGIRRLKKAFSWNKGYKEYFAVKACPNPFLMQITKEEGCGFDCSSYNELILADSVGVRDTDIMFSSNATPKADFKYARALGAYINLDDITHIDFLENNGGIPDTISIRYNPGGVFGKDNLYMGSPGDAKYGFTKEQLEEGIRILMNKGVNKFGLHAFLASNMLEPEYFPELAKLLFNTVIEMSHKTGAVFSFINLSGGIGIPYRPEDKPMDIEYAAMRIHEIYNETIVKNDLPELAIFTEAGRYITGPHGVLVTKAIHEKNIYKHYIGCDACAANLLRPAMYGAYHHITVSGKEDCANTEVYDITGGLCENNDKFAIDRALPHIDIGDYLIIHDAGAHGFAMGYNYNGKTRSSELLLREDGSVQMIRRAETAKDYFATFDFCDIVKIPEDAR